MSTVYIVDLEAVPTRYTVQWKAGLPAALETYAKTHGCDVKVVNISGGEVEQTVTPGAFLNFAGTNQYKCQQGIEIAKLFAEGKVQDGDKFLFTDAWNPVIIQVKYMVELLRINAELMGIWHAGSYDPQDFLGRLIIDKRWSRTFEQSLFHALDVNIYATEFHIDLFKKGVFPGANGFESVVTREEERSKILLSGQPHDALVAALEPFKNTPKRDLILFPHRVAPEKQPEIFRDLAASMPEYEFVVCQDRKLSKDEYHQLLGESKMVFSANLQETLGISAMEGVLVGSMPFLPDRLSYTEMYEPEFRYPSEWTENWDAYLDNKEAIIASIISMMTKYDELRDVLEIQRDNLLNDYLLAHKMFARLCD